MTPLIESILKCRIEGNVVFLPKETLSNYADVRKALMNAGGAYKKNTFVFKSDAKPYVDRLTGGESVNIKKEFQFFRTPDHLADMMVELAQIKESHRVLEPSSGDGSLIEAIYRAFPHYAKHADDKEGVVVDYWELMPENVDILGKKGENNKGWSSRTNFMGYDFLSKQEHSQPYFMYDRILSNPPFNKGQDMEHIRKMYSTLKDGGRIVTIASNSWRTGSQKKQVAFREWLNEIGAEIRDIDSGEFKESGTMVSSCLIIINK